MSTFDQPAIDNSTNQALSNYAETSQSSAASDSVEPNKTQCREPSKMYEVLVDWVITLDLDAIRFEAMNLRRPDSCPHGKVDVTVWETYDDCTRPPSAASELIQYLLRINTTIQSDNRISELERYLVGLGIGALIQDRGEHVWAAISKSGMQKYGLQSPVSFSIRIGFIPGSPLYRWSWV
jgi:hypothetical protein